MHSHGNIAGVLLKESLVRCVDWSLLFFIFISLSIGNLYLTKTCGRRAQDTSSW